MESNADHSDLDPTETEEWLGALGAVLEREGPERAHFLIDALVDRARNAGAYIPYSATTSYKNTIPADLQPAYPGDLEIEQAIETYIRWNAMAMVVKANRNGGNVGGHIASYASVATLWEVGFNHFFRAPSQEHGGDLIYFQGHSSPGIYARAFLEGRLSEEQLANFRQESGRRGLSSYPHPWLMPEFWQFPTVSMGLTSIQAIYQARFMRYLQHRGLAQTAGRKVWAFLGDGEMDEPESLGAISLAAREELEDLIFVINCNLQRLDGPVRGNSKIIQELEAVFRGAGWNVIKVIWGSGWDELFARDHQGLLTKRMEEAVDGDYQLYRARDGAFIREHFFGKYPELRDLVAGMSDDELWALRRGGHDPTKVYAAYQAAVKHSGQPTVILVKSIKGFGMGEAGESLNITHQQKKMGSDALRTFRDRFGLPVSDEQVDSVAFVRPAEDSKELRYLHDRRRALGGYLPARADRSPSIEVPELSRFKGLIESSGERELSTTMAFVRVLMQLTRDKNLKQLLVPIVADEARTFGMEGMFRQVGIYAPSGQLYQPVDEGQIASYREQRKGQILQEGISEAGAMCSWIAAGNAYANHGLPLIPFYIFYSMFGFQRVGDLIWAAADMQTRGFLLGATSGRTTLNGEGLQHQDGSSHVAAAAVPNCVAYDPTFAYEVAVIMQDGLRRMYQEHESVFYYLTLLNENYPQPAMPKGAEAAIRKGMYLLADASAATKTRKGRKKRPVVQLLGCGSILREVIAAARLLDDDFGIAADVWSVPSFNELRRDGLQVERHNLLRPTAKQRSTYVEQCLAKRQGPVIASSDYVRAFADQIRPFVPRRYITLGTDGFGRSDTRERLRDFFEVDRRYVTVAALRALAEEDKIDNARVDEALKRYAIDPDKPDPWTT
ncbi:MAG: pyruvate dehydrogenase (acetyl-transferring), homodimeric type [Proteobacteria bacterium]|nr:pyruvate dehydrogenase (acetyl-transferring), homodimeric type [Pseudomonadota bacterium]